MTEKNKDNTEVYKRSIGATQWTVLSIFITASELVFAFSFGQDDLVAQALIRFFGIMIYWLGFFIYNRYRNLNKNVASYLIELEEDNPYKFQTYLNKNFHSKGVSTQKVLLIAGMVYTGIAIAVSVF